jgi:flagellar hook-basal body complex protein FliE
MNISPIQPSSIQPIGPPIEIGGAAPSSGSSEFGNILQGAIDQVEGASANAKQSVQQFLSGDGEDLHSTVLAVQRAGLEFDMLMQVRNKVVSAYQEVMRMQM